MTDIMTPIYIQIPQYYQQSYPSLKVMIMVQPTQRNLIPW